MSHLVRGVWIEMSPYVYADNLGVRSHLVRGVWIEMRNPKD